MRNIYFFKNWKNIGILWPILLHLCITIPLASLLNIWVDEAYTLDTTDHGFIYAFTQALEFENQPPLYFALLSGWRLLNDSMFFARGFSILSTVLAIATCYPLSRRYLPNWPVWVLPVVIALHPYTIWTAVDIRLYGFAIWLTTLLMLFFFDGYLAPTSNNRARGYYLLVMILALFTHYFFLCLLIAQAASLLIKRQWKRCFYHLFTPFLACLCVLPTVVFVLSHRVVTPMSSAGGLGEMIAATQTVLGRISTDLIPIAHMSIDIEAFNIDVLKIFRYLFLGLLIGIGIYNRRKMTQLQKQMTIMLGIDAVVMSGFLMVSHTTEQGARYGFHLFLVTLLWAGTILTLTSPRIRLKALQRWLGVALIFLYTFSLSVTYSPLAKEGDWLRVTTYLQQSESLNQPIVLFTSEGLLPITRYYKGINQLVALPNPMGDKNYDLHKLVLENEQILQNALLSDHPVESFWLVLSPSFIIDGLPTGECELYNINLNCQFLNQFLAKHYQIEKQKDFFGSSVNKMKLKAVANNEITQVQ